MRKELASITSNSFYATTLYNPMFRIRISPGFISLSGSVGVTQAGQKKKKTSTSSRAHLLTVRGRQKKFFQKRKCSGDEVEITYEN